jgi:hypothetical protein
MQARTEQPKQRPRRRFRHKAELAAIVVMLVGVFATGDASASTGTGASASARGVYLDYDVARHQSTRLARGICADYTDCYRYQVPFCKRRGPSTVNCLAMFAFTDGDVCGVVIKNRKTRYGYSQRRGWTKCKY